MNISVSDPMGLAGERTSRMLFKPFNIGTWFTLGFAAFLSQLGEGGGGNFNFNFPGGGGGGGRPGRGGRAPAPGGSGGPTPDPVMEFLAEMGQLFMRNAHWVIPVLFIAVALGVVVMWLRARGKFIFLDSVARNHAAIVEPWKRLAPQANSFFRFDLTVAVLMLLGVLAVALIGYLVALPDLRVRQMGGASIAAIGVGISLSLLLLVGYLLVTALAENFLIPLMYLRAQPVGPAWVEFRTRILPGHVGIITAYFLLRGVLNVAAATAMFFATCLTCFIAAIPYLGTVLFLPIFVFMRAYSLYFLEQFGPEYKFMSEMAVRPVMAFPVIFNTPPEMPPAAPPDLPVAPPPIPPDRHSA